MRAMRMLLTTSSLLLCLPITWAGDWVVETHSMVIRAPPSIAGIEDAAIGDVSLLSCTACRCASHAYIAVTPHLFLKIAGFR